MNGNSSDPLSPEGPAPTSEEKLRTSEATVDLRNLVSEIRALSESGGDPARLWQLRQTFNAHRLQQINQILTLVDRMDRSRVPDFEQIQGAHMKAIELATTRTDLTIPEALFLHKSTTEATERERQSLIAEKEAIEAQLEPGKRRRRQHR